MACFPGRSSNQLMPHRSVAHRLLRILTSADLCYQYDLNENF
jgi:hypothetical protein